MLHITAFGDESIGSTTGALVLASYMGTEKQWARFGTSWEERLAADDLLEFKAWACERGEGPFKGWGKDKRHNCCDDLISIITGSRLVGVATVVDLRAYSRIKDEMKSLRRIPTGYGNNVVKYGDPYYLAFQYHVRLITEASDTAQPGEKVAFQFDLTDEYQHKCSALFADIKHGPETTLAHRMGDIAYNDSVGHPGLQAADMLAYEMRRFFEETQYSKAPRPKRWQWKRLIAGHTVWRVQHFTANNVEPLLMSTREQWG